MNRDILTFINKRLEDSEESTWEKMSNLQTQAANRYVVWNGKPKQYEMWRKKY